jgi:hypothetical protein
LDDADPRLPEAVPHVTTSGPNHRSERRAGRPPSRGFERPAA